MRRAGRRAGRIRTREGGASGAGPQLLRRRSGDRSLLLWGKRAGAIAAIAAGITGLLALGSLMRRGLEAPVYRSIAEVARSESLDAWAEHEDLRNIARGIDQKPGSLARTRVLRRVYGRDSLHTR